MFQAVSIRTRDLIIFLQSFFAIIQIQDKQNNMAPWNIWVSLIFWNFSYDDADFWQVAVLFFLFSYIANIHGQYNNRIGLGENLIDKFFPDPKEPYRHLHVLD